MEVKDQDQAVIETQILLVSTKGNVQFRIV